MLRAFMLQSFTCVFLCFACLCLVIVHRGVMIRGLMSVYAQSVATTLLVVLKALNNSQHIHVANSSDFPRFPGGTGESEPRET